MKNKMKILWAVSSVGKGHIMRDLAIVNQLKISADVDIDWLAPDPAGNFLRDRGYNVLECSSRLAGSGGRNYLPNGVGNHTHIVYPAMLLRLSSDRSAGVH